MRSLKSEQCDIYNDPSLQFTYPDIFGFVSS